MAPWPVITGAGLAIGTFYGIFRVGGSSFATPVLGLLGVPGLVAIAAPLPATILAAIVGATAYARRREVEWPSSLLSRHLRKFLLGCRTRIGLFNFLAAITTPIISQRCLRSWSM